MDNLLDPVVLFFILGLGAGLLKSDLKIPEALYETLSLYLLLAIGLKGGIQLARVNLSEVLIPLSAPIMLGILIPLIAYAILHYAGRFSVPNSAAIAAHYGSVSAVTFAFVLEYLDNLQVGYEQYVTVILVLMEVPAILVAIAIVRLKINDGKFSLGKLAHEVFLGKSVYLLLGGMLIGLLSDQGRMAPIKMIFLDPFKGVLAFFLLEMGIVASRRLRDLKSVGGFLIGFGIGMPLLSAVLATLVGRWVGLSFGGTVVLSTLAASASYIAAPAAMRIAVPQANPTLYLTAALGITFPFNITVGIPLYYQMTRWLYA